MINPGLLLGVAPFCWINACIICVLFHTSRTEGVIVDPIKTLKIFGPLLLGMFVAVAGVALAILILVGPRPAAAPVAGAVACLPGAWLVDRATMNRFENRSSGRRAIVALALAMFILAALAFTLAGLPQ